MPLKQSQALPASCKYIHYTSKLDNEERRIGKILKDTNYAWISYGARFEVISTSDGSSILELLLCSDELRTDVNVTCVVELPASCNDTLYRTPLLIVGLKCGERGMVCVVDVLGSKVLRAIDFPKPVVCMCLVASEQDGWYPFCNILCSMDGIVAVGLAQGGLCLLDLRRHFWENAESCEAVRDETNPCSLIYLSIDETEKEIVDARKGAANGGEDHLSVIVNRHAVNKGEFSLMLPDGHVISRMDSSKVFVSCIFFVRNLGCLVVGFNFGVFQIWDLVENKLVCTSDFLEYPRRITHFAFQEPNNDPYCFCYLWVVYEADGCPPMLNMHTLHFENREPYEECSVLLFTNLRSLTHSYTYELPPDANIRFINCYTVEQPDEAARKYKKIAYDEDTDVDSTLCLFAWEANNMVCISLFDLNKWYIRNSPHSSPSLGHSHAVYVDLVSYNSQSVLDVRTNTSSFTNFKSILRTEEQYHPSAYSFESVCLLRCNTIVKSAHPSVQKAILAILDENGPALLQNPSQLFLRCLKFGLRPLHSDVTTSDVSVVTQREFLLSLALEHQLYSFLFSCAFEWSSGRQGVYSCSLETWLNWAWSQVETYRVQLDEHCIPLYDYIHTCRDTKWHEKLIFYASQFEFLHTLYLDLISSEDTLHIPENQDLRKCAKVLERLTLHARVVDWFTDIHLLPEFPEENENPLQVDLRIPYPVKKLTALYSERRSSLKKLRTPCASSVSRATSTEHILFIDSLIHEECNSKDLISFWMGDSGSAYYPPPSLQSLLRAYKVKDVPPLLTHSIVIYVFMDLVQMLKHERYECTRSKFEKFPAHFGLPPNVIKITKAFWFIDHEDFETGLNMLLDPFITSEDIKPWQHRSIIRSCLYQGQPEIALRYVRVRRPPLHDLEDVKLHIALLLVNGLMDEAFEFQRMFHNGHNEKEILRHFYYACLHTNQLKDMLTLPFSKLEEEFFAYFLQECKDTQLDDIRVMYFLQRGRFIEGIDTNDLIMKSREPVQKISSIWGQKEDNVKSARDIIVEAYANTLPGITRQLKDCCTSEKTKEKTIIRPTPLSVNVQHGKYKSALYQSSFVHATLKRTLDARASQLCLPVTMKKEIQATDAPFLCSFNSGFENQRVLTPVVIPAASASDHVSESYNQHGVDIPESYLMSEPVASNDPLWQLNSPHVKRKVDPSSLHKKLQHLGTPRSSLSAQTPHSILKVNSFDQKNTLTKKPCETEDIKNVRITNRQIRFSPSCNDQGTLTLPRVSNRACQQENLAAEPTEAVFDYKLASSRMSPMNNLAENIINDNGSTENMELCSEGSVSAVQSEEYDDRSSVEDGEIRDEVQELIESESEERYYTPDITEHNISVSQDNQHTSVTMDLDAVTENKRTGTLGEFECFEIEDFSISDNENHYECEKFKFATETVFEVTDTFSLRDPPNVGSINLADVSDYKKTFHASSPAKQKVKSLITYENVDCEDRNGCGHCEDSSDCGHSSLESIHINPEKIAAEEAELKKAEVMTLPSEDVFNLCDTYSLHDHYYENSEVLSKQSSILGNNKCTDDESCSRDSQNITLEFGETGKGKDHLSSSIPDTVCSLSNESFVDNEFDTTRDSSLIVTSEEHEIECPPCLCDSDQRGAQIDEEEDDDDDDVLIIFESGNVQNDNFQIPSGECSINLEDEQSQESSVDLEDEKHSMTPTCESIEASRSCCNVELLDIEVNRSGDDHCSQKSWDEKSEECECADDLILKQSDTDVPHYEQLQTILQDHSSSPKQEADKLHLTESMENKEKTDFVEWLACDVDDVSGHAVKKNCDGDSVVLTELNAVSPSTVPSFRDTAHVELGHNSLQVSNQSKGCLEFRMDKSKSYLFLPSVPDDTIISHDSDILIKDSSHNEEQSQEETSNLQIIYDSHIAKSIMAQNNVSLNKEITEIVFTNEMPESENQFLRRHDNIRSTETTEDLLYAGSIQKIDTQNNIEESIKDEMCTATSDTSNSVCERFLKPLETVSRTNNSESGKTLSEHLHTDNHTKPSYTTYDSKTIEVACDSDSKTEPQKVTDGVSKTNDYFEEVNKNTDTETDKNVECNSDLVQYVISVEETCVSKQQGNTLIEQQIVQLRGEADQPQREITDGKDVVDRNVAESSASNTCSPCVSTGSNIQAVQEIISDESNKEVAHEVETTAGETYMNLSQSDMPHGLIISDCDSSTVTANVCLTKKRDASYIETNNTSQAKDSPEISFAQPAKRIKPELISNAGSNNTIHENVQVLQEEKLSQSSVAVEVPENSDLETEKAGVIESKKTLPTLKRHFNIVRKNKKRRRSKSVPRNFGILEHSDESAEETTSLDVDCTNFENHHGSHNQEEFTDKTPVSKEKKDAKNLLMDIEPLTVKEHSQYEGAKSMVEKSVVPPAITVQSDDNILELLTPVIPENLIQESAGAELSNTKNVNDLSKYESGNDSGGSKLNESFSFSKKMTSKSRCRRRSSSLYEFETSSKPVLEQRLTRSKSQTLYESSEDIHKNRVSSENIDSGSLFDTSECFSENSKSRKTSTQTRKRKRSALNEISVLEPVQEEDEPLKKGDSEPNDSRSQKNKDLVSGKVEMNEEYSTTRRMTRYQLALMRNQGLKTGASQPARRSGRKVNSTAYTQNEEKNKSEESSPTSSNKTTSTLNEDRNSVKEEFQSPYLLRKREGTPDSSFSEVFGVARSVISEPPEVHRRHRRTSETFSDADLSYSEIEVSNWREPRSATRKSSRRLSSSYKLKAIPEQNEGSTKTEKSEAETSNIREAIVLLEKGQISHSEKVFSPIHQLQEKDADVSVASASEEAANTLPNPETTKAHSTRRRSLRAQSEEPQSSRKRRNSKTQVRQVYLPCRTRKSFRLKRRSDT